MSEIISPEQYETEIAILRRKLDSARNRIMESAYKDECNPFDNPTEYKDYNQSYCDIVPELKDAFNELPLNPEYQERRKIRKYYNIAGMQILFLMISSNVLGYILSMLIVTVLQLVNPEMAYKSIVNYYNVTSVAPVNMLVFLICNTAAIAIGLKWSKIRPESLFRTQDFSVFTAIAYFFIAFFIQHITADISGFAEDVIGKYGYVMYDVNDYIKLKTPVSLTIEFIYGVIIAPITEEMFYRGFVLKNLSRASQRFGIFMSALIFGLMHGTVPQIILGFCMGIFLAHITMKHNSLIPAILVHIFNNSLYYIFKPVQNITSESGIFTVNMIYFIILAVGVFMLIKFMLENKIPSTSPEQARRGLSIAVTSVPLVIAVILFVFETIYNILKIS